MKKIQNIYLQAFMILLMLVVFNACEPIENDIKESDIRLPKSEIISFSPSSALIGSEIVLTGTNLDDELLKVYLGSVECVVVSKSATSATIVIPRIVETNRFVTTNSYSTRYETKEMFIPVFPETVIDPSSLRDTLYKSGDYVIKGQNLDLLTGMVFKDTVIFIDGTTVKDPSQLVIKAKETNPVKPKIKAKESISFTCKAGNVLPSKPNLITLDNYPSSNLVLVDPKSASKGETVKFIFDNFDNAKYITEIKVGKKVASFKSDDPYIQVIIPSDATDGSIEIKNSFGVSLKYADKTLLILK